MCVTLGSARLSNTIIYASKAQRQGRDVHVLAYQNRAQSPGPNAMILPIPTDEPMGPENIVDTREARWFLEDLDEAARIHSRGVGMKGLLLGAPAAVQVFNSGSYTVVLATDAEAIQGALNQVPVEKRPTVAPGFFTEYAKLYPGWPIAVCCWSGRISAEPLLWWYVSKYPRWLFFPTVDAHDGGPPLDRNVARVDHALLWGSRTGAFTPHFRQHLPAAVLELIAPALNVSRPNGWLPNGDYWLREGGSNLQRIFPNGFGEMSATP